MEHAVVLVLSPHYLPTISPPSPRHLRAIPPPSPTHLPTISARSRREKRQSLQDERAVLAAVQLELASRKAEEMGRLVAAKKQSNAEAADRGEIANPNPNSNPNPSPNPNPNPKPNPNPNPNP